MSSGARKGKVRKEYATGALPQFWHPLQHNQNSNNSHSDKKYIAIFSNKLIIKVYRINTVFGCYCLRRRDIDIKKNDSFFFRI